MKKIMILAVVAALVGLSLPQNVSAQTESPSSTGSATQDDQGASSGSQGTGSSSYGTGSQGTGSSSQGTGSGSTGTGTGSGSMGTGSSTGTDAASSNYTEIKTTDLPSAVSSSISEKYPEYKTEKVYRGKDGTYKVKLSKDDQKETVFFDQKGDAVKMQK